MSNFDINHYMNMPLGNEAKRVKLTHHIRNIWVDKMLKHISEEDIKKSTNEKDEYSFGCSNLLVNAPFEFLSYMFEEAEAKELNLLSEKKTASGRKTLRRDPSNSANFFMTHERGEASIIFTSLKNKAQAEFVEAANKWGEKHGIVFEEINSDTTDTQHAEDHANFFIGVHNDKHVVFVTNSMAARSFSVPKIVNGVMMVNAPGPAAAEQKYNRLTTFDCGNENKQAHMYWFNFKSQNLVCPLVTAVYADIKKPRTDMNGKPARTMLDAVDIFVQDDETTAQSKWTEKDIFDEMRRNASQQDVARCVVSSSAPEFSAEIGKMLAMLADADFEGAFKDIKFGKADVPDIDPGRTYKKNSAKKPKSEANAKKKYRPIPIEVAARIISLLKQSGCYACQSFISSCCCVIGAANMLKIGEPAFKELWKIVDEKIVKLL